MDAQKGKADVPLARLNANYINMSKYNPSTIVGGRQENPAPAPVGMAGNRGDRSIMTGEQAKDIAMQEFSKGIVGGDEIPELAEDVESAYARKENVRTIKEMPNDYKLRCTKGSFKSRFLTLSHSLQGETFGSGPPEQVERPFSPLGVTPFASTS